MGRIGFVQKTNFSQIWEDLNFFVKKTNLRKFGKIFGFVKKKPTFRNQNFLRKDFAFYLLRKFGKIWFRKRKPTFRRFCTVWRSIIRKRNSSQNLENKSENVETGPKKTPKKQFRFFLVFRRFFRFPDEIRRNPTQGFHSYRPPRPSTTVPKKLHDQNSFRKPKIVRIQNVGTKIVGMISQEIQKKDWTWRVVSENQTSEFLGKPKKIGMQNLHRTMSRLFQYGSSMAMQCSHFSL